jgi:hypothetical protein
MYEALQVERMNYEDLGNWGLDDAGGPKMHLHFFGRGKRQFHQVRGQHIALFPKDHPIYQGHLKPLNDDDITRLSTVVAAILREAKYVRMAELAEL